MALDGIRSCVILSKIGYSCYQNQPKIGLPIFLAYWMIFKDLQTSRCCFILWKIIKYTIFCKKNEENHCSITCIFCLCNISKTLISGIYWGYDFSFLECRPVCRMPTILIKKCRMPTAFKIPGIMTSILVVTYKGEMEEEGNQPPTQHANYHKMTGLVWCM